VRSTLRSGPQLWGRRIECDQLDQLLARARAGGSAAIVMRGQAGVGKTALLDYLLAHAAGCRVVRALGVESEMELAYAVLHQLCAPFLDRLDRIPAPQRDALSVGFGLHTGATPDPFRIGLAVLSLLSDVAEAQPLLCLVDDAQWLDSASAQALGFVARRLAAESIVLILAARDSFAIQQLAGLPELTVRPLGDPDARSLLASAIPGKLEAPIRDRIVAESSGNPLALLELPKAWTLAAFAGGFDLPDAVSVSARIEESFRRQLKPLPRDSRKLLLLTAAEPVGDPLVIWGAAGRLGITKEASGPATATGLLDIGINFRFRHPLLRSVVYRDASIDERRQVHAALAGATDARVDPDRRVWHLAAAAAGPDEEVAAELEGSASRAQARGGMAASAAFLQRSVALSADPAHRARRALAAAQATFQAGAFETAFGLLGTAEAGPLDGFQRAQVDLTRGYVAFASGFGSDAPPLLLKAARQLEAYDAALARETYLVAWIAASLAGTAGGDIQLEISRAAQGLPPSTATPRPLDLLLDGVTLVVTDGLAAAVPTLRRAMTAVVDIPIEDVVRWGAAAMAPSALLWDFEAMLATMERHVQVARDAGALAHLPTLLHNVGLAKAWMGDFSGAASVVEEADSVSVATGSHIAPYTLLRLLSLQGREAEVKGPIANAIKLAENEGQGHAAAWAHWAAAVLHNGFARYSDAASEGRLATSNPLDHFMYIWALPELIEGAARAGEEELASDALERLLRITQPIANDLALGIEARCRALLSGSAQAEALYRDAIDRLGRTRLRPELARAHLVYGEWLRREGHRVDARTHLRTALEIFDLLGMKAFAGRARRELLATGEKVRKRSVETLDELTPQELQIAQLASDRRTNVEIATQLFLSPRTVEWHLLKVFAKLGVTSRRELHAALSRSTPSAVEA
jgi:DNA-binding CsgD family transcriptional regulator